MGRDYLKLFVARYRSSLVLVIAASVLLNLLVFAGTIYMMLVYDSVLPSRSIPTLVGLFAMIVLVYLFQALFEAIRGEAMLSVANGVHDDLFAAVHHATVSRPLRAAADKGDGLQPIRDLDAIHTFLAGPGPTALIDLPWVIVFLFVLTALHWWLGLTALVGVIVLSAIALWSNRRTASATRQLQSVIGQRSASAQAEIRNAETAVAMGMQERLLTRTRGWEADFLESQSRLSRLVSRFGGAGRTFRVFLQSLILTVGALLVIDDKASGGVILASSVLSGRALAPVDSAIANWRGLVAASTGWERIVQLINAFQKAPPRSIELGAPSAELSIRDLWVAPPGVQRMTVQGAALSLTPGQALAIIGPSAAGKTSLMKAMLGIWRPQRGEVRLDGATLDQWAAESLGRHIGYVPQTVELVDGTIGENIARFDPDATSDGVIAAARAAGMHETILAMPDGYDTRLTGGGLELSAGQRQRVGLARALYGEPFLVALDEANSNLDSAGDAALAKAVEDVRKRGGIVVMITHRPATLGPISHVAVMAGGRIIDLGERDEVMKRLSTANPGEPKDGQTVAARTGPAKVGASKTGSEGEVAQ
ncbi:Type I secretion system ATPase, PrtD [Novosphingobium aromaticivorans DSM 12444]|uniref:Type I secretion system ATPase, PrtD n=1 Tax=Novosphingobium aromaticivorans (strain ATCC 700278 / DSM 12444 / CCUG 56034 / CIP 105152 / NBRC 16084 / F199) TaxID=279238 RepID=Q2GBT1_NOVAD|nr:Type I secretion system ATPase, PrtD [Novosphingobium aromaticivorans DSM 12444]SCY20518.1 ATP-binding cassette, subfamily C [Novosphingobium aromaticivorans]